MTNIKTPETTKDISFTLMLDRQTPIEIDFQDENLIGYPMTVLEREDKSTVCVIYDEDERNYYMIHEKDIHDPDYEVLFELRLDDKNTFAAKLTDYLNNC